jgi:hypothetical protein
VAVKIRGDASIISRIILLGLDGVKISSIRLSGGIQQKVPSTDTTSCL